MKFINKIISFLLLFILFSSINSTSLSLRDKRRSNGFRVLMAKGYIDDISDFIMAFLKMSKIQDNVKSLASCINDLIKAFSGLATVTQTLNDNPTLTSFMGVISQFNQLYKDGKNNLICKDSLSEFWKFLYIYINDPNIGKGDTDGYFKTLTDIIKNRFTRVYYELVRSNNLFTKGEHYKAGEVLGDLFYNLIRLQDLSDDTKDFPNYSNTVTSSNEGYFQNDANEFKRSFSFCLNSLGKIIPDINNFSNKDMMGIDVIPNVSDLLKSIVETNQLLQCYGGIGRILDTLRKSNYSIGQNNNYRDRDNRKKQLNKKTDKPENVPTKIEKSSK